MAIFLITVGCNASIYNGDATLPAIVVNSATALTDVVNGIPHNRRNNYTGAGISPTSVENMVLPDPWGNIPRLQGLYNNLKSIADFTSPTDPGFTLGTTQNLKIVVIDNELYSVWGNHRGGDTSGNWKSNPQWQY